MICEGWSWSGLTWSFAEYINWWPVSSEGSDDPST